MIPLAVTYPWMLALLVLGAVPLLARHRSGIGYSWTDLVPADAPSAWLDRALRAAGVLTIVALVLGLSGLHRPEHHVERVGRGAHIVLLVDRSSSMDQPFANKEMVDQVTARRFESKGRVARRLLAKFIAGRRDDLFGAVVFSTTPIPVLALTANHEIVQGAVEAGNLGRGLAETAIGSGLERALGYFEDKPYTGSRIVVLVSDGAGELGQTTRLRIAHLAARLRVSLYWIYIRSAFAESIFEQPDPSDPRPPTPERALHDFFSGIGIPYKAYTAESPEALEQAIEDVGRLQNLPLHYLEAVGRRDLAPLCFAAAMAGLGVLVLARLMALPRW